MSVRVDIGPGAGRNLGGDEIVEARPPQGAVREIRGEGGVPAGQVVALEHGGTEGQKRNAAEALRKLANNADNKEAIPRAGGNDPLEALARQNRWPALVVVPLAVLARCDRVVALGAAPPLELALPP